ncbi:MAG: hypothetical protein ACE14S_02280 [Candidatus Bathyarchaeia archaeon]
MSKNAKLVHPSKYSKTQSCGMWVFDKLWLFRTETKVYEFDRHIKDWILVDTRIEDKTPQEMNYHKKLNFCVVFPDPDQRQSTFGKKTQKLFGQVGTIRIRDELKNTWLLVEKQNAIDREGALGETKIMVRTLENVATSQLPACYASALKTDDACLVELSEPQKATIDGLKQLEAKNVVMVYFGKIQMDSDGLSYGKIALNA